MNRALTLATMALWACAEDGPAKVDTGTPDAADTVEIDTDVPPDTTDIEQEVDTEVTDIEQEVDTEVEVEVDDSDVSDTEIGDSDVNDTEVDVGPLPDPHRVAGPLTLTTAGALPFLTPADLTEVLLGRFSVGRELFVADWTAAPDPTRPLIDGIGPLFHATSCVACHPAQGRPPTILNGGGVHFGVLMRLARPDGDRWVAGDPTFGSQFQPAALAPTPAEGIVRWAADLARTPSYIPEDSPAIAFSLTPAAAYGPLDPATRAGPRLSPHLAGMGLLDLVPDDVILAWEDVDDRDGDGISGRAARLTTDEGPRLGRFGWKAVKHSLRTQTAAAFVGDIGITSPLHPIDDCTPTQMTCLEQPSGGSPEISVVDLDAVDEFMSYLGVPAARRPADDPRVALGHQRFTEIGCASCHRPELVTGDAPHLPPLARVTFYPYTDLLLHDMGEGLADPIGEGDASPSEWRTPPLWGLGLVEAQTDARFLHDGRATSLDAAILWHGGEAEKAREAYRRLAQDERDALLEFLRSL